MQVIVVLVALALIGAFAWIASGKEAFASRSWLFLPIGLSAATAVLLGAFEIAGISYEPYRALAALAILLGLFGAVGLLTRRFAR